MKKYKKLRIIKLSSEYPLAFKIGQIIKYNPHHRGYKYIMVQRLIEEGMVKEII